MTGTADQELSHDAFLGGRVHLWQPRRGYRAGLDPVLLAAAVPAKAGQSVLELGCGAGAAVLCLNARVAGLEMIGVERQAVYAELARRNASAADAALTVVTADLAALPPQVKARRFDHVIANPPYHRPGTRSATDDPGREAALSEETPLAQWIEAAARRLAPGGYLHVIHRAERLPDLLSAVAGCLGAIELLPIAARAGRAAHLVLLRARRQRGSAFRLHAPLLLHRGASHQTDGSAYRPQVEAILRHGAALEWPDVARV